MDPQRIHISGGWEKRHECRKGNKGAWALWGHFLSKLSHKAFS